MKKSEYEKIYVRTDLACESGMISPAKSGGCDYRRKEYGNITVEQLDVLNEEGVRDTEKEIGRYITVSGDAVRHDTGQDCALSGILEREIRSIAERAVSAPITEETRILVAGIGNELISSDSLGPAVAGMVAPTRHLTGISAFSDFNFCEVSVIKTAVLGQTGIESSEIVKSLCNEIKPNLIVAVDALAARSMSRLASTVQISDTGIAPGAGIGNSRLHIDRENLGVPVISIGVPTVVNTSTLLFDTLYSCGITELDSEVRKKLDNSKQFFMTTKDCDLVCSRLSKIISSALNGAFAYSTL